MTWPTTVRMMVVNEYLNEMRISYVLVYLKLVLVYVVESQVHVP